MPCNGNEYFRIFRVLELNMTADLAGNIVTTAKQCLQDFCSRENGENAHATTENVPERANLPCTRLASSTIIFFSSNAERQ